MQHSQEIGKLAGALAKAQSKIKAATFDKKNPHFNSRYATLNSVIDAIRDELSANEIAVIQGTDKDQDGTLICETMLVHASGEWIKSALRLHPKDNGAQSVGSALTYGRRYLLAAMTCNASEEDDDGNDATGNKKPVKDVQETKPTTNTTRKPDAPKKAFETVSDGIPCTGTDAIEISKLCAKLGAVDKATVLKTIAEVIGHEIKSSAELTAVEAKLVIGTLFERVTTQEETK